MRIRALGLRSELALAGARGTVEDRGDYLVVRTPDDPGYFYGNLLVLPAPPQVGEVAFWSRRFAHELGGDPRIRHVTLSWDGTSGDVGAADELRAAGFTIEVTETMTAGSVRGGTPALPIRKLTPHEVLGTADLAWSLGERHDQTFREFLVKRAHWHRALAARGDARFFGAYAPGGRGGGPDRLVASCGLVELGDGRARYQDVQTAEAYRGRGLAGALLAACARDSNAAELVIVVGLGHAATRVYERAGFYAVERTASACRYPDVRSATRAG